MKSKPFVLKKELANMTLDNILLTAYTDCHRFLSCCDACTVTDNTLKIKRSVSAPKCQFSPAGQSLIQPFLEPFEHNLGKKSSIKRLFQPTVGPISALGPNQP